MPRLVIAASLSCLALGLLLIWVIHRPGSYSSDSMPVHARPYADKVND